jgi:hypothetical protein
MLIRKDRSLDILAEKGNVAQFISFSSGPCGETIQHYSRLVGLTPNHKFDTLHNAFESLLARSSDGSINIRSFSPTSPRSKEFVYGISNVEHAGAVARRLLDEGLFIIANETVDVKDGGVSGVVQGDVIEFSPDDTPRCVEKPGVAAFPKSFGLSLLTKVYGFFPAIGDTDDGRLEFSIHPKPRGWKSTHTLLWEYERSTEERTKVTQSWPNRFSRHIGDKAYGLLIADGIGLPVPRTTVFGRRVAPFSFGTLTGSLEVWTRTCPYEPEPGRYTTVKGWVDPFALLQMEDPAGNAIASLLCQSAVKARYSGATIVMSDGALAIEGRQGEGTALMLGRLPPQMLPNSIIRGVEATYRRLAEVLGPVKFEWVHDGSQVWIVQLHRGQTESSATVVVPGDAELWLDFEVEKGIEALRAVLATMPEKTGLQLVGDIGLTSHLADLIRKATRPARISRSRLER